MLRRDAEGQWWHRKLDPTRPMTSWRSAWRSLRKAAGLPHVRFHDGRHTALTRLAEKGVADWVIRAQFGHVSPAMMAVYSHVRLSMANSRLCCKHPLRCCDSGRIPVPTWFHPAAEHTVALNRSTRREVRTFQAAPSHTRHAAIGV